MKGGKIHGAGILLQMPEESGDKEPAERHFEEQEASDTRKLSIMRNQGVPNWQGLVHYMLQPEPEDNLLTLSIKSRGLRSRICLCCRWFTFAWRRIDSSKLGVSRLLSSWASELTRSRAFVCWLTEATWALDAECPLRDVSSRKILFWAAREASSIVMSPGWAKIST